MLSVLNYIEIPQLRNVNITLSHTRTAMFEIRTLWSMDLEFNPLCPRKKVFDPSELESLMKVNGNPFQFLSVAYMDVIITSR